MQDGVFGIQVVYAEVIRDKFTVSKVHIMFSLWNLPLHLKVWKGLQNECHLQAIFLGIRMHAVFTIVCTFIGYLFITLRFLRELIEMLIL